MPVFDTDCTLAVEHDALDEGPGDHVEVRPVHHRMQVRAGSRGPPALADVAVELRETLLPVTVYVIGAGIAGLFACGEECLEQRIGGRSAFQREWTVVPAVRVVGRGRDAV